MILRFFSLTLMLLLAGICSAQNNYDLLHVDLDSVVVRGENLNNTRETNIGARITRVNAQILQGNQTKSLSELLSDNTLVYIKSMGQGALATSSFRGTSSNHTQVNWNGIAINPSMSGNFDFSQIPVFFADHVTLYHGGGFLKNGTGALGGSVNISNTPSWDDTTFIRAFAEYGSWNSHTEAATFRFLQPKALYQTRLYYQASDNDYRYLNKVLQKDPFYENRQEADYRQTGLMQEAYFKLPGGAMVSTNLWFQYGNRRLPQPLTVNRQSHEKQKNTSLKYYLGYEAGKGRHEWSVKAAYLLDYLDYRKWSDGSYRIDEKNYNTAQALNLKGNYNYACSPKLSMNVSMMYNYDFIRAASYIRERVDRHVMALQGNVLWEPTGWLSCNAQIMGELNDKEFSPTYGAGVSARLLPSLLQAKANVSYNYRYPALNDLYWNPGGNPALVPEKGFSYDASLVFTPRIDGLLYFKIDATYYMMNIDNWIMWLPTQDWYWQPTNVQNVLSHGLELFTEVNLVAGDFKTKLSMNYAYARSLNRERRFEDDGSYRKQLPYIPKHKANIRLGADYKNAFFSYQLCYTGVRYTTQDESYSTNAYWVHDAEIGYKFTLANRFSLTPKIRANNLLNTYYESTEYYPMPLRNIFGSIVFSF